jgi:hypothetical protein
MKYAELMSIDPTDRNEAMRSLSEEELDDLIDETPITGGHLKNEDGRKYFDDIGELRDYAQRYLVPAAKPYRADRIVSHEGAHVECALALGAATVRYYVLDTMHEVTRNNVFVEWYHPDPLPNLAWAAISMHPYNATDSLTDVGNIRQYGYANREHVKTRIARWNERESGIYIPEPQSEPKIYL